MHAAIVSAFLNTFTLNFFGYLLPEKLKKPVETAKIF